MGQAYASHKRRKARPAQVPGTGVASAGVGAKSVGIDCGTSARRGCSFRTRFQAMTKRPFRLLPYPCRNHDSRVCKYSTKWTLRWAHRTHVLAPARGYLATESGFLLAQPEVKLGQNTQPFVHNHRRSSRCALPGRWHSSQTRGNMARSHSTSQYNSLLLKDRHLALH